MAARADVIYVQGDVSGTWAADTVMVTGQITIQQNQRLTIEPGVKVLFQGHYKFIVYGLISAIGTPTDSILFTASNTMEGWHSIRFIDSPDTSYLIYCIVQYGRTTGVYTDPDVDGGGIYCWLSDPIIAHCSIRCNSTAGSDGSGTAAVFTANHRMPLLKIV